MDGARRADDVVAAPSPSALDEPALAAALRSIASEDLSEADRRAAAVALLRPALSAARDEIETAFRARQAGGVETARRLAAVTDQLIRLVFEFVSKGLFPLAAPTASERMAVAAVGGYGRGEMAPFSDVDLLFITPHRQISWGESVIESTLYILWDLRLKVGHATRSLSEVIRMASADMTIRTAVLEMRHVSGDAALSEEAQRRLRAELFSRSGADFVRAKLDERDARHERMGGSRYLLEPNVKESKGGLRDLNTLLWFGRYLYDARSFAELVDREVFTPDEVARCRAAEAHLWSVRCGLHYLAGRAQEKLSFDQQFDLAELFGYREAAGQRQVERFMKRHFIAAKDVGDLTRIFCVKLEHEHQKAPPLLGGLWRLFASANDATDAPYAVSGGRLTATDLAIFEREPVHILWILEEAIKRELLLHPDALRGMSRARRRVDDALRADPETKAALMRLLTECKDPVRALRRLSETGVLGRLLPEFGRVIGLMQFNLYHHYTVDEHTILAVDVYRKIRAGQLKEAHAVETEIAQALPNARVMTIALLLHDIGKGLPEDHSVVGEQIARRVCPELGMTADETDLVAWLVREHLTMSDVAQKRDIGDAATLRAFADVVRSPSRLKMLYLLTACDIRAVGPGVWNGWKAQLLRQLYRETLSLLGGEGGYASREERVQEAKADLRARLADWSDKAFEAHAARMYPNYWIGVSPATLQLHAEMMRGGPPDGVMVRFASSDARVATKVAFYTSDHPGIFARMTGALALARASVLDARAYTTKDGMALNTFWIRDADDVPFDQERLADVERVVRKTLMGEVVAREALASRRKLKPRERAFDVAPYVVFDNAASDVFTVIETNGRDRVGLLHDLSTALLRENVNIFSAIIATYGEHAVDVFYVKDVFGMKLTQETKRARIEAALLAALQPSAEMIG